MFTGLIVETGEIVSLSLGEKGGRLTLRSGEVSSEARLGDSISVNGVCLTVVLIQGDELSFDMSGETLRATNLGELRAGDRVNIEPSLRLNTKLGGHFVTGHVDGPGKLSSRTMVGDNSKIAIKTESWIADFLVEKGSVAVDGISLTVVDVFREGFSIVVIPHTAQVTTIGRKRIGDTVNIEVDILGKYVAKFLSRSRDDHFHKRLIEEGFA